MAKKAQFYYRTLLSIWTFFQENVTANGTLQRPLGTQYHLQAQKWYSEWSVPEPSATHGLTHARASRTCHAET